MLFWTGPRIWVYPKGNCFTSDSFLRQVYYYTENVVTQTFERGKKNSFEFSTIFLKGNTTKFITS